MSNSTGTEPLVGDTITYSILFGAIGVLGTFLLQVWKEFSSVSCTACGKQVCSAEIKSREGDTESDRQLEIMAATARLAASAAAGGAALARGKSYRSAEDAGDVAARRMRDTLGHSSSSSTPPSADEADSPGTKRRRGRDRRRHRLQTTHRTHSVTAEDDDDDA